MMYLNKRTNVSLRLSTENIHNAKEHLVIIELFLRYSCFVEN